MTKNKVILYKDIRHDILVRRNQKQIKSVNLSMKIGKSPGWLSFIENGKISTISYDDLKKLYIELLDLDDDSARVYIDELCKNANHDENELQVYDNPSDEEDTHSVLNEIYVSLFNISRDKRFTNKHSLLTRVKRNLSVEPSLTLHLMSLPIYKLSKLSHYKKQEFLYIINSIIDDLLNEKS